MDIDAPPTPPQIPPLESGSIIEQASRGEKIEDWNAAQDVFRQRLDTILTTWEAPDSAMYLDQLSSFLAPPHTVQRLAELLIEPYTWYHDSAKYTRALIRILSVRIISSTDELTFRLTRTGHLNHCGFLGREGSLVSVSRGLLSCADPMAG